MIQKGNATQGIETLIQLSLIIGSLIAHNQGMSMLSAILYFIIMTRYCYMFMYSYMGAFYFAILTYKFDKSEHDRYSNAEIARMFIMMTIISTIGVIALMGFKTYLLV